MSHITKMDIVVTDLDALQEAAEEIGCTFKKQKTHKWYGHYVGDYELPKGVDEATLGHCDYAIGVKGKPEAYEVGVTQQPDSTYSLFWDFWSGGYGLQAAIGTEGHKLMQKYTEKVCEKSLAKQGFHTHTKTVLQDGTVQLKLRRGLGGCS